MNLNPIQIRCVNLWASLAYCASISVSIVGLLAFQAIAQEECPLSPIECRAIEANPPAPASDPNSPVQPSPTPPQPNSSPDPSPVQPPTVPSPDPSPEPSPTPSPEPSPPEPSPSPTPSPEPSPSAEPSPLEPEPSPTPSPEPSPTPSPEPSPPPEVEAAPPTPPPDNPPEVNPPPEIPAAPPEPAPELAPESAPPVDPPPAEVSPPVESAPPPAPTPAPAPAPTPSPAPPVRSPEPPAAPPTNDSSTLELNLPKQQASKTNRVDVPIPPRSAQDAVTAIDIGSVTPGVLNKNDGLAPDGRRFERFQFQGEAEQPIVLTVLGSENERLMLTPFFVVFGPDGQIVARNNFLMTRDAADERLYIQLPSTGTYEILVISDFTDPNEAGRFSLALQHDVNFYTLDQSGVLSESSDRLQSDNSPADTHEIQGEAGDIVRILATSPDFDPYVFLLDASGNVVARDDDSGNNFNSFIEMQLPEDGTYMIVVNAFSSSEQGRYRLTVTRH